MHYAFRPLLLVVAVAFGASAHARGDERRADSNERQDAGDRVREVERDGGRVLQAEPMQRSGREVYRLKVITPEGRVRVLDDSRRGGSRPDPEQRREPEARRESLPEPQQDGRRGSGRGDDNGRRRSPDY